MQDLTFRERIVLAELAGYDGPNGSYPSIVRLAEDLGMSQSAVSDCLAVLQAKGRLRRKRRRRRTTISEIAYSAPFAFRESSNSRPPENPEVKDSRPPENPELRPPENPELSCEVEVGGEPRERASPQCASPELCAGLNQGVDRCRVCGMGDDVDFPF